MNRRIRDPYVRWCDRAGVPEAHRELMAHGRLTDYAALVLRLTHYGIQHRKKCNAIGDCNRQFSYCPVVCSMCIVVSIEIQRVEFAYRI